jgi:hypothetical protein
VPEINPVLGWFILLILTPKINGCLLENPAISSMVFP